MLRLILFFLIVLGLAAMFAWVADRPGSIVLDWLGTRYEVSLMVGLSILVSVITAILVIWSILRGVIRSPMLVSRFFQNRRRDRGYQALSRGLIAASSGDVDMAKSLARESGKLLKDEPLVQLLGTQTALLEGKREEAKISFQSMLQDDNTKLVALRGLFLEAERRGENEAARQYASEAASQAPTLPWAGMAKLRYLAIDGAWDEAIKTLETNRAAGLVDKEKAKRQRAVLLTAKAIELELSDPDAALKLAKEAHKLAKGFVPAAVIFAQAATRLGDVRGATKVIEATWKLSPHPDLAESFTHVRSGDSVQDRLKRAKRLDSLQPGHREGNLAVTQAAIDALDWETARKSLEPVLTDSPSERACLLMAEIEEGEHGDKGKMRVWLARAVRAPADAVWTADGQTSQEWLAVSPVTGEIDAFEWKVPVEKLGAEAMILTADDLKEDPVLSEEHSLDEDLGQSEEQANMILDDVDDAEEVKPEDLKETLPTSENDASDQTSEKTETESDATANEVEFALERRPDDPGVDPEKVPEKQGFKIF